MSEPYKDIQYEGCTNHSSYEPIVTTSKHTLRGFLFKFIVMLLSCAFGDVTMKWSDGLYAIVWIMWIAMGAFSYAFRLWEGKA